MSAPTVGTPTFAVASNIGPGTLSVDAPTHAEGDLLIAIGKAGEANNNRKFTAPSGWVTLIDSYSTDLTSNATLLVAYKVASASEPSSYDFGVGFANTNGKLVIVPVSGAADPDDIAIVTASVTANAGGTMASPTITPTQADSLILRAVCGSYASGSCTPPAGYTEIFDNGSTTTSIAIAYATHGASATGTADFTQSPGWHSNFWLPVLAIAPAAAPTNKPLPNLDGNLQTLSGNLQ